MHDKPDGNPSGLPFVFFPACLKEGGQVFRCSGRLPDPVSFRFSPKPAAGPASGSDGAVRLIPFSLKSSRPAVFVHKTVSPACLSPLLFSPDGGMVNLYFHPKKGYKGYLLVLIGYLLRRFPVNLYTEYISSKLQITSFRGMA